jgi:hypothetical protein
LNQLSRRIVHPQCSIARPTIKPNRFEAQPPFC